MREEFGNKTEEMTPERVLRNPTFQKGIAENMNLLFSALQKAAQQRQQKNTTTTQNQPAENQNNDLNQSEEEEEEDVKENASAASVPDIR